MSVVVGAGLSSSTEAEAAFEQAAEQAWTGLDGNRCDLCVIFAGSRYLGDAETLLKTVHRVLHPEAVIGCGAGGVVGAGREIEDGSGVSVWALSAPDAEIEVRHLITRQVDAGIALGGLPDDPADYGDAMIVLADPSGFSADALLMHLNDVRPGMPVLGGLASAARANAGCLFVDHDVVDNGAVCACLSGVEMLPCVSQGALPVGPEMTVTGAEGNVITDLASRPALDRLKQVIGELEPDERDLAAEGLLLGVVIDENQPSYERGDFLVRPVVGVDPEHGAVAVADRVRVGQTVRLQVRDAESAGLDLKEALDARVEAVGNAGAAGALLFTCNGRGAHMFGRPDHDALLLAEAFDAPTAGFFCAGEIGPVGGRNFLHGFTATMAVFPRE
ncbi:MAG: FIST C-terminal domain-containing protein [Actinomycetota bacterium]|nr:FIST C-terminal domain-containing protein [Actinomycetota bacterium]